MAARSVFEGADFRLEAGSQILRGGAKIRSNLNPASLAQLHNILIEQIVVNICL